MQEISHILSPSSLLSVTVYYGAALQPQLMKVCLPQCGLRCQSASRQRSRAPPVRCPRPGSSRCCCCCCSARAASSRHRPEPSVSPTRLPGLLPSSISAGQGAGDGLRALLPPPRCGDGAGGPGRAHAELPLLCAASRRFPGKTPLCCSPGPPSQWGPILRHPQTRCSHPCTPISVGSHPPAPPAPPVPSLHPNPARPIPWERS